MERERRRTPRGCTVYRVRFEGRDYYFGSITAIYDVLTPEQIKVRKERLWAVGITEDKPYQNTVCTIYKATLHRHTPEKVDDKD